ncbi:PDZ domain-containing protein [Fictibacillus sp. KIGAM418]|uniref:PDZ domain-containing protein n=1 Tax=Fictibacillus marinisediminis TaxID=2878389 RepID=A0A9X1XEP5_9BACL|nr:PDZ domain-containing protein [Fictibacillus marinisediminis]MCK6259429.1 PDZ domain-containing protein [Fictibacillus marinisediminis]
MDKSKFFTLNSCYITSTKEELWSFFSTTDGWNRFLTDVALVEGKEKSIEIGDEVDFIIGELSNKSICILKEAPNHIVFWDKYKALLPDGSYREYELYTAFSLEEISENLIKITVKVDGYDDDEMMQWIRECGEMGWRQTLYNIKSIVEFGLDLRNDIFNYPRIGVINYTATSEQLLQAGSSHEGNFMMKVYPNSPAFYAGIREGDIITHINNKPVTSYYQFVRTLSHYFNKENLIEVVYWRNKQLNKQEIRLTYDDQYTGMINPEETPLSDVALHRKEKSIIKEKHKK